MAGTIVIVGSFDVRIGYEKIASMVFVGAMNYGLHDIKSINYIRIIQSQSANYKL